LLTLSDQSFDPGEALSEFTRLSAGGGGIVSFLGSVRPESASGSVSALHLQAYSPMTENGILNAISIAKRQWKLLGVRIIHRTGNMNVGEPIVFVAASAIHRRAAFEGADYLMDYLKTDAVFWKKETTNRGERWIEPRKEDYEDADRGKIMESQIS